MARMMSNPINLRIVAQQSEGDMLIRRYMEWVTAAGVAYCCPMPWFAGEALVAWGRLEGQWLRTMLENR